LEDIIFVIDGTEEHEAFYVKRMKTAQEYARKQYISVNEFIQKIHEGIGKALPLLFFNQKLLCTTFMRKKKDLLNS